VETHPNQERHLAQGWPRWFVGSNDTWSGRSDGSGQGYFERNLSALGLLVLLFGGMILLCAPMILFGEGSPNQSDLSLEKRLLGAAFCGWLGLVGCGFGWGLLQRAPALAGMSYRVGRVTFFLMGLGLLVAGLWRLELEPIVPGLAACAMSGFAPRWRAPGPPPTDSASASEDPGT
jgi:hypothetical protein